jgi:hypothetical protein
MTTKKKAMAKVRGAKAHLPPTPRLSTEDVRLRILTERLGSVYAQIQSRKHAALLRREAHKDLVVPALCASMAVVFFAALFCGLPTWLWVWTIDTVYAAGAP